jgi:hypothetical protein
MHSAFVGRCVLAFVLSTAAWPCSAQPLAAGSAMEPHGPSSDAATVEPIDWSVLNLDPTSLIEIRPTPRHTRRTSLPANTNAASWNRTENADGSSVLTLNQPLPTFWDTKVGIDLGLAAPYKPPSPARSPERLLFPQPADQPNGAAWASATAPALNFPIGWDKASVNARFDPVQDESRLGTRFVKSVPLGERFSVTLENGFALTHVPTEYTLPDGLAGTQSSNVFDFDRAAKLNILSTGTSIGASSRMSTIDDEWLNSLSAEQKILGGLSVTGTVSETLEGDLNKSISAGFKRTW